MNATFFARQEDFRDWLEKNHLSETELIVGYYKVGSKKPSMTWSESVDQALCFGWIDSVRKSIDEESYCIRFTPRKKTSIWSDVNIRKVEVLKQSGQMKPEGIKAFELRSEHRSRIYSHEKESEPFPTEFETLFKSNQLAWDFFSNQAPSYKKVVFHWILSAKQHLTRVSRLEKIIQLSENQQRVKL